MAKPRSVGSSAFALVQRRDGISQWRHQGNELTVLVYPTRVAPVATFGIVYCVGSRHERTGSTGAAHLLEHLMFKGTARFNAEQGTEIPRLLKRVGASFNATTWLDRTNFYETLAVEHLPLAVEIEADRMCNALVSDADVQSERTVVLNELDRSENEPSSLLMKSAFATVFVEHSYHHPTIGFRSDIERMTGQDLRHYYQRFYTPCNAVVIVAGDVEEASVLDLVDQHFGCIAKAHSEVPESAAREPEQRGERRFEQRRAGELGQLLLTWPIPEGLHSDCAAVSVLTQILAEGVTSRLYQALVEANHCLSVHAYPLQLHDPGVVQVAATLAPQVEHRAVEEVVRTNLRQLASEPPSDEELARAKVRARTDLAFHRESPALIVAGLTEAVAMGDWQSYVTEMEQLLAVTAEDVVRVCATYLTDQRLTAGWFVPEQVEA